MSRILQCPFQGILAMRKMMHWAGPKCLASIGQPDATESQAGKPSGDGTAIGLYPGFTNPKSSNGLAANLCK